MSLVFINYPLETFTPTSSGALATVISECCRSAERSGLHPYVITRCSQARRFPWPHTICIDPPYIPANPLAQKMLRVQRKVSGWRHLRHKAYACKVASTLHEMDLARLPLVLNNDPEMAVFLRRRFPSAFIVHWFHNQIECSPRVQRQFAASVNVVAAVSNFTGQWVGSYYGIKHVHTVYNGVDRDAFFPEPSEGPLLPVINFVGRTGIEKAPDLLLEAALALTDRTKNFGLQLVGSNHWDRHEVDAYQLRLQALVDELSRSGISVHRPGHVGRERLPYEFRRAQIHVVPSRWDEPFGLTTIEGMACGLATVASDTGGTPEVVGDCGLLFERDSVSELTKLLESLVADPDLCSEFGRKARARAETFTWERTWNSLTALAQI